jgi:hypothetical protein
VRTAVLASATDTQVEIESLGYEVKEYEYACTHTGRFTLGVSCLDRLVRAVEHSLLLLS